MVSIYGTVNHMYAHDMMRKRREKTKKIIISNQYFFGAEEKGVNDANILEEALQSKLNLSCVLSES